MLLWLINRILHTSANWTNSVKDRTDGQLHLGTSETMHVINEERAICYTKKKAIRMTNLSYAYPTPQIVRVLIIQQSNAVSFLSLSFWPHHVNIPDSYQLLDSVFSSPQPKSLRWAYSILQASVVHCRCQHFQKHLLWSHEADFSDISHTQGVWSLSER